MASTAKGNCYLCGAELGKVAMKNHLLKMHGEMSGQECCLLKIEGAYNKNYWLYIDIPISSTLNTLATFLRKIWLECCGHMSAFSGPGRQEIGKGRKLGAFSPGDQLLHEYDFGSTTETLITVIGRTFRKPRKQAVRLLARNIPPVFRCAECGAEAKWVCPERFYETDNPFYCEQCLSDEEMEEMVLPVTNSPRMGVCGYEGDQDTYIFISPKVMPGGKSR